MQDSVKHFDKFAANLSKFTKNLQPRRRLPLKEFAKCAIIFNAVNRFLLVLFDCPLLRTDKKAVLFQTTEFLRFAERN